MGTGPILKRRQQTNTLKASTRCSSTRGGVDFAAVDMLHADMFTMEIMALVAEKEQDP